MHRPRGRHPRPWFLTLAAAAAGAVAISSGAMARESATPHGTSRATVPSKRATSTASTATPIKHVVVIIGENHTFDNLFGTYEPPKGQTVRNLLSEKIVTASGNPGKGVGAAIQRTASDTTRYEVDPQT